MNRNFAKGGGQYADTYSKNLGKKAEMEFLQIINRLNLEYRNASKKEEIFNHWDFLIKSNNVILEGKYEVKSMKAKERGQKPNSNIIFIEIKSVGGNKGWIYGDADYIAFQTPDGFLIFPRKNLQNYTDSKISSMPLVNRSGLIWTTYTRKDRHDLVAIFPINELIKSVSHLMINSQLKVSYYIPNNNNK